MWNIHDENYFDLNNVEWNEQDKEWNEVISSDITCDESYKWRQQQQQMIAP